MEYKATLDLKAKIISGLCVILFAALTIYNIGRIDFNASTITSLVLLSTVVLVVSLVSIGYLLRPLKYEITDNQVIIRRLIGNRIIERENIKLVILPSATSMKWTIRTLAMEAFSDTSAYSIIRLMAE